MLRNIKERQREKSDQDVIPRGPQRYQKDLTLIGEMGNAGVHFIIL